MFKKITSKQMGDAGERLVAAELTLTGIPAMPVDENWPHYDLIAQPPDDWPEFKPSKHHYHPQPQRISVKTRTFVNGGSFVGYNNADVFDWIAIVVLPARPPDERCTSRRVFILPRDVADKRSYFARHRNGRGFRLHKLADFPPSPFPKTSRIPKGGWGIADYENNFTLSRAGNPRTRPGKRSN